MNSINTTAPAYCKMQLSLYTVNKSNGILPFETDLTGKVVRVSSFAVNSKSSTVDIWMGMWLNQEKVAMKTLRGVKISPDDLEVR